VRTLLATAAILGLSAVPTIAEQGPPPDAKFHELPLEQAGSAHGVPGMVGTTPRGDGELVEMIEQTQADPGAPAVIQPGGQGAIDAAPPEIVEPAAMAPFPPGSSVEALIGTDIVDGDGTSIGAVRDLALNGGMRLEHAIVDVGGFLGVGARTVALPLAALRLDAAGDALSTALTRDEIEALPEVERTDGRWEPRAAG
jgi:hypothetical protein